MELRVKPDAGGVEWTVKTALREFTMNLPGLKGDGALASEEAFEDIVEALRAMERKVEVRRSAPQPGSGRG